MSQHIGNEDYIRRYLLGELSEEEQEQIEKRLLSDDDFYQQVLIAEDELTYEFVCDELPEQEKVSFRRHVLPIPERRSDVKFAKVLRKYVRDNAPRLPETPTTHEKPASWLESFTAFFRRPVVAFSLTAALLLAVSISVWMAIQNRRLQNQIVQLESQKTLQPIPTPSPDLREQLTAAQQRSAQLEDELRRAQELRASAERSLEAARQQAQRATASGSMRPVSVATLMSFLLTSGGNRDSTPGGSQKIDIPSGARAIRLNLDLATNTYRSYRAVLKTVEGEKELLTRGKLRARSGKGGTIVSLIVPTILLSRGDYQIQLDGVTPTGQYTNVDTYYFRVPE